MQFRTLGSIGAQGGSNSWATGSSTGPAVAHLMVLGAVTHALPFSYTSDKGHNLQ